MRYGIDMSTAATAPTPTTATKTVTRKVDVLDENSASALTGLPIFVLRQRGCLGDLPGGVWRQGKDYFVDAEQAVRLRSLRSGLPALHVFHEECELENRRAWELDKVNREAIAAADARCAAEKAERQRVAHEAWKQRQEREERNKAAMLAASGSRLT